MKKLLICIAAISCSVLASAQGKGEMYISGTFNFSAGTETAIVASGSLSEKASNPLATSFGLGAEYGYFAAKNLRLAFAISYGLSSSPVEQYGSSWSRQTTNVFSLNPNIAYYVKIVDRFYYTPEVGVSFGFGNMKSPLDSKVTYTTPYSNWNIYANLVAFEFRATQHFAMGCTFGSMGYNSEKLKDPDDKNNSITDNTFRINFGTAGLYARYYF